MYSLYTHENVDIYGWPLIKQTILDYGAFNVGGWHVTVHYGIIHN